MLNSELHERHIDLLATQNSALNDCNTMTNIVRGGLILYLIDMSLKARTTRPLSYRT